jgi:transcriptional regulator with XRE-family HTH domain
MVYYNVFYPGAAQAKKGDMMPGKTPYPDNEAGDTPPANSPTDTSSGSHLPSSTLDTQEFKLTLGRRIKTLRRRRGFTLDTVSKRTGLSTGLLSQIENGSVGPSLASLWKISLTFGVKIGDFFPQGNLGKEFELVRAHEREKVVPSHADPNSPGYSYDPIASFDFEGGRVEVFAVEVEALSRKNVHFYTHSGRELIYVIDGSVEFLSERNYQVILHPGDMIRFPARYLHGCRGLERSGKLLAIMYSSPHEEQAEAGATHD